MLFVFFSDFESFWETLHDLFCLGDFPGFLLLGQPHLGCSGYGLRRAEPDQHKGSKGKGGRISGHT